MRVFEADYFDGITADAKPVLVTLEAQHLSFGIGGEPERFLLAAIRPQAPVGSARRVIELPDGGRLETRDHAAFDSLRLPAGNRFWRLLYFIENHLAWVLLALLLAVLAGWGMIRYGVPLAAEQVARMVPAGTESGLGEQVLKAMDHKYGYFKPTRLKPERRQALEQALAAFCARQESCPPHRLEFRRGGDIGANAMALPGGIIVVTDELVALSRSDDQVLAVLAHELGHVQRRHSLRHALQATLSGLVLVALTGDFDALASGLPAVLLQLNYSRSMETEADAYALATLRQACIPPSAFAEILTALQRQAKGGRVPEMLSSHPDTAARIAPFKEGLPADCGIEARAAN